jgi:hypothetical protein
VILGLLPFVAWMSVFPRHAAGVTLIGALCYGLAFSLLLIGGVLQRLRYRANAARSLFSAIAALLLFFWFFEAYRVYRWQDTYIQQQRAQHSP